MEESGWDLGIDYSCFIDDAVSSTFSLLNQNHSSSFDLDFSQTGTGPLEQQECSERECPNKRVRTEACSKPWKKAYRERLRREKLNDSFLDLSSILDPGRAVKTDKLAILSDAIRVLNQLRTEAEDYKEENKKLKEEIKILKAEKNELREEKLMLKAEKDNLEQQLKGMAVSSPGLMPPYPAAYHAGPNKMTLYPSYGMVPMWHYLPPSIRDTSRDHELRPPAA